MEPIIDHIQVTVRDMSVAVPFYDKLMPLLGYDPARRVDRTFEEHDLRVVNYSHEKLDFCINSPRTPFRDDEVHRRKPGSLHHLAFQADSRAEVDRLYQELLKIGAAIVEEPRPYPEYGPHYYAVFFKDPDGIKYEFVHDAPED